VRWARAIAASLAIAALAAAVVSSRASSPVAPRSSSRGSSPSRVLPASRVPSPAARLPAGPGRDLTRQNCLICHSAMLITQQHKDSTGWGKTVALMQKWGAPVRPSAHDTLITYLRNHFGSRPPGANDAARPSTPSNR